MNDRVVLTEDEVVDAVYTRRQVAPPNVGRESAIEAGRQAVVGIAGVCGPLRTNTSGQAVREHGDGETLNWAWEVPCEKHWWGSPVPRSAVLHVIGMGTIRIASGLFELDQQQSDQFQHLPGLSASADANV